MKPQRWPRPMMRLVLALMPWTAGALVPAAEGASADPRLRTVEYRADAVYRLEGIVGYQIDLEFEPGEAFVGLAAGDLRGLDFDAQRNHLFLKPKAAHLQTNVTILTDRRQYYLEYSVSPRGAPAGDTLYALKFLFPESAAHVAETQRQTTRAQLLAELAREGTAENADYWFCGAPSLRPTRAYDDGVHTYLRFGPTAELPAIFVRNADGTESLANYSVADSVMIVHRLAERLVLRRGRLSGCIVNRGFAGSGRALPAGTVSPAVQRAARTPAGSEAIRP